MTDLTKLTVEELYKEMEALQEGLEAELSMDGSGELGGKIMDDFEPRFDEIQAAIESRPEEEIQAYLDKHTPNWKDELDPSLYEFHKLPF